MLEGFGVPSPAMVKGLLDATRVGWRCGVDGIKVEKEEFRFPRKEIRGPLFSSGTVRDNARYCMLFGRRSDIDSAVHFQLGRNFEKPSWLEHMVGDLADQQPGAAQSPRAANSPAERLE